MKQLFSPTSLIFLSATLACVGISAYFTVPALSEMGTLQAELESRSGGVAKVSDKGEDLEGKGAQLKRVQAQSLELLPPTDGQYDLSVQIDALAKDQGVALSSLSFTDQVAVAVPKPTPAEDGTVPSGAAATPPPNPVKKVTVSIGVAGEYAKVQSFIEGLTGLGRFITLDQVVVTGDNATSTAIITAFAHYLPKK